MFDLPFGYYLYSGLLNCLVSGALSVLTFLKQPKVRMARLFAGFAALVAVWCWLYVLWLRADDPTHADFFLRTLMIPVILIAPTFLHFAAELTQWRMHGCFHALNYVLALGLSASVYTDLLASDGESFFVFPYWLHAGPLYAVHLLQMFASAGWAHWLIYQAARRSTGRVRYQLLWLFWGCLLGFLSAFTNYPGWYRVPIPPLLNGTVSLYVLGAAYAILRHEFLDIRVVIRKSLIYSLLITLLTVSYFGLIYLLERVFQLTLGYHSLGFSLAAFALMALAFQPLKVGIQRLVDQLFFRASHEDLGHRLERLEQEVRQADKLKAISLLAAGMAHEIKNPLSTLKTFAEYLPEKGTDPEFQRTFQRLAAKEVSRIDQIVRQLMNFAKPAPTQLQPVQITNLLEETLNFLTSDCLKRQVQVHRVYDCDESVQADPQQLRQVFLNLLLNSLEAMDGRGGELAVATARHNGHLVVTIEDTGPGISKEHLTHIFDPFFTTKASGTGLGLSVVQGIITEHRGRIDIASVPGLGTTVTLQFPL